MPSNDINSPQNPLDTATISRTYASTDVPPYVDTLSAILRMLNDQFPGKIMLSVTETAQVTGLCEASVRAAMKSGELPRVRIGRRMFCPVAQLARYLEEKTAKKPSAA